MGGEKVFFSESHWGPLKGFLEVSDMFQGSVLAWEFVTS